MTIDSIYLPQTYVPNDARTYIFEFEHIGAESIVVSYIYVTDDETSIVPIPTTQYTLTLGSAVAGIYEGGTVAIAAYPPSPDITSILISRRTPMTQLVDYQPYTPFPADVTEFALDKLTLIEQEIRVVADNATGGDSGGGGGGAGLFVPIAGTIAGLPVTGEIEFANGGNSWRVGQTTFGGANWLAWVADSVNSLFSIITKDLNGDEQVFNFQPNGQFEFSSSDPTNNEVWAMSGQNAYGGENTFGLYSYNRDTGEIQNNSLFFYPASDQIIQMNKSGKLYQSGVVLAGDDPTAVATKKYVDDAVVSGGALPPDAEGDLLVGTGAGWASAGTAIQLDTVTTPGNGDLYLQGRLTVKNIDDPGIGWNISVDNVQSVNALFISAFNQPNSQVIISTELGVNDFRFTGNGQLILPQPATDADAAVTKGYIDSLVPDGTAVDQTVRWAGSSWVGTSALTIDAAGEVTASQALNVHDSIYFQNQTTTANGWNIGADDYLTDNALFLSGNSTTVDSQFYIAPRGLSNPTFIFSNDGKLTLPVAPTAGQHALNRDAGDARYVRTASRGPGYAIAGGRITSDGSGAQSVANCWGAASCSLISSPASGFVINLSSPVSSAANMVVTSTAIAAFTALSSEIEVVNSSSFRVYIFDDRGVFTNAATIGFSFAVHDAGA